MSNHYHHTNSFWHSKRVFITGHTGFKGAWLCRILLGLGAEVIGYALKPPTEPNLFDIICKQGTKPGADSANGHIHSIIGDIRDFRHLKKAFDDANPEIVFHLAAQPIVRAGYLEPVLTYETNVMGTVNICECVRQFSKNAAREISCNTVSHDAVPFGYSLQSTLSFVNITTDKVYLNREQDHGYREDEMLDGYDPYSNSKSCSELVTHSYINSYFKELGIAASTARAGNVIGGGDFAADRIIPDCVRAAAAGKDIIVRNPNSIRPYQHVLEPLFAYMMIAEAQYNDISKSGYYNVGPNESDCITTGRLCDIFCSKWNQLSAEAISDSKQDYRLNPENIKWYPQSDDGPHEAGLLKLDCTKLKQTFGWAPKWDAEIAIEKTVEWYHAYLTGKDVTEVMDSQISEYLMRLHSSQISKSSNI